ncbi:helix-turn-helix domain-containing protein [Anaerovorax odorimutans]|uniref:helix-turn-helix domain-containing protein n=1 Tax=Anaerovorax odorimutans TaxID=109327 RepID=UPI0003FF33A5|nr:helix-turn-helix transcriptional regulator [Anaerovorax odorimutans]
MNFGEKIKYLMVKNNVKYVNEFAENVGLSPDTINKYMKKDTLEGIEAVKVKRIADYFGVSIDYFFNIIEDKYDLEIAKYDYFKEDEINKIIIEDFIKEIKSVLNNADIFLSDGKIINSERKYIIDSIDIGLKIMKQNI